jgi:hypothetical protein
MRRDLYINFTIRLDSWSIPSQWIGFGMDRIVSVQASRNSSGYVIRTVEGVLVKYRNVIMETIYSRSVDVKDLSVAAPCSTNCTGTILEICDSSILNKD